jgi:hypothetical protein
MNNSIFWNMDLLRGKSGLREYPYLKSTQRHESINAIYVRKSVQL